MSRQVRFGVTKTKNKHLQLSRSPFLKTSADKVLRSKPPGVSLAFQPRWFYNTFLSTLASTTPSRRTEGWSVRQVVVGRWRWGCRDVCATQGTLEMALSEQRPKQEGSTSCKALSGNTAPLTDSSQACALRSWERVNAVVAAAQSVVSVFRQL